MAPIAITLTVLAILFVSFAIWTRAQSGKAGHRKPAPATPPAGTPTAAPATSWWKELLNKTLVEPLKKAPIYTVAWWALCLWVLSLVFPWIYLGVVQVTYANTKLWQNAHAPASAPKKQLAPAVARRNENGDRYKFFVEGPRKHGWKIIPAKVDVEVPLDGRPRYLGINLAFLGGSRIKYTCPGYWSGGEVRLFSQASEPTPHHLAHEETIPLYNTGSVTGGDAIRIWGVKTLGYRGVSNRVIAEVFPLPNHIRIATAKRVLTRNPQNPQECYGYDWGTVQVGNGADSPLWQVYIRYADMNGITLSDDLVQQKPGQVMIGVVENNKFRDVLQEETVVSRPANLYGTYSVPSYEEDLFLRIQPPNVPEGEVMIEVIYDIDYTAR
ncbi:MAG: hypothetical protein K8Q97_03195 [Candidatus Andersenbacteria bacterium]|nr:hypothetical protein [Candidatus Andersenbacteria bacterium]